MRAAAFHPAVPCEECLYHPNETGLTGMVIYAGRRGSLGIAPRLKVTVRKNIGYDPLEAVVSISDFPHIEEGALPPAVARQVFAFIRRNLYTLKALWDERITTEEASERFKQTL